MTVQHNNYNLLAASVKAHSVVGFQRRERTSTKTHMCIHSCARACMHVCACAHTHTHTHTTHIHYPLFHLQFMKLWNCKDFFQKATSVPWQTHKSFYFSAVKQKSFLKPLRSLSLCSFGKCILCCNKPAVKCDKKPTFPVCMCFAVFIQRLAILDNALTKVPWPDCCTQHLCSSFGDLPL